MISAAMTSVERGESGDGIVGGADDADEVSGDGGEEEADDEHDEGGGDVGEHELSTCRCRARSAARKVDSEEAEHDAGACM